MSKCYICNEEFKLNEEWYAESILDKEYNYHKHCEQAFLEFKVNLLDSEEFIEEVAELMANDMIETLKKISENLI